MSRTKIYLSGGKIKVEKPEDINILKSEHAKLEAANKVLMEALDKIANCKQGDVVKYIQTVDSLALDAVDAADEIMKENG